MVHYYTSDEGDIRNGREIDGRTDFKTETMSVGQTLFSRIVLMNFILNIGRKEGEALDYRTDDFKEASAFNDTEGFRVFIHTITNDWNSDGLGFRGGSN